ncbi:MAG TPA: type IV toxin-antitoxin system AbiEi family antitoxin domain-containing protein [Thermoleophilaceae bacterium]|nr:type IV toxin-antitoxin system AbiEi family antitoxin domain-containing protein [Thermoleophilaceae bacterium]
MIDALATAAHGVVTRSELLDAGLSPAEIRSRLRRGLLIGVHPGVYRAGHHAPSTDATYLAAVRACGAGSVLTGRAAAHHLGLLIGRPPVPEVIAPTQREVRGVITHRSRSGLDADAWEYRGIPVTTVARTLVDLARVLPPGPLARACHEAGVRFGTTPAEVDAVLRRRPSSAGAAKLREITEGRQRVALSALERRFLEILRSAGLALPVTNRVASGRRVDCRWPDARLTVELDSYRFHGSRHAWERDRLREREARARGDDFRRFTWGDVFERPETIVAELRTVIPRSRPG